ncbi:MAG: Co2+/Mg2+ efflux protein ApaG [Bdellovibrionales bacterium]|nr:Co2+/Mg2+ efflux protein ApaG [Bdellovibrionales bacterium]
MTDTPQTSSATPYVTRTRGIVVSVVPKLDEARTRQAMGVFVYSYTITIRNEGKETVQLLSRHWIIRDGFGRSDHVVGEGVVGHQPTLDPGQEFTYTSFCPLPTPTGSMEGSYNMTVKATKERFDAMIDVFPLLHAQFVN